MCVGKYLLCYLGYIITYVYQYVEQNATNVIAPEHIRYVVSVRVTHQIVVSTRYVNRVI